MRFDAKRVDITGTLRLQALYQIFDSTGLDALPN